MQNILFQIVLFFGLISSGLGQVQNINLVKTDGIFGGNIISLLTGEKGTVFAGVQDRGLFVSTDYGKNWEKSSTFNGTVSSICLNSKNEIYITNAGIKQSINNGKDWSNFNTQINDANSIVINSKDYIFVGTVLNGLFISTDRGNTWKNLIPSAGIVSVHYFMPNSIFINSFNHLFIFSPNGMLKSTDDGISWESLGIDLFKYIPQCIVTNTNDFYFTGTNQEGIIYSTDYGATWNGRNSGLTQLNIKTLTINNSGHIFAGTKDSGIFISTNNGNSWSRKNNGLKDKRLNILSVSKEGILYAGTQSKGIFYSSDNGESWLQSNKGISEILITDFVFDKKGNIYAFSSSQSFKDTNHRSYNDNIFKFSPIENRWIDIFNNLLECNFRSIVIDKNNNIFIATEKGIFSSADAGGCWQPKNNGLKITDIYSISSDLDGNLYTGNSLGETYISKNCGESWEEICKEMAYQPVSAITVNKKGYIFFGINYQGVYISKDKGKSFQKIVTGLEKYNIMWNYKFFTDLNDFIYLINNSKELYISKNNGESWEKKNSSVKSICFDKDGLLYAGKYDKEISISRNCGTNWEVLVDTLSDPNYLSSIAISPDGFLFVGTTNSVYKSTNKITEIKEIYNIPQNSVLYQNYPNPFNPATKIKYYIPNESLVKLKIFNMLGQLVQVLEEKRQKSGQYEVSFNAAGFPSGVYFYKLDSENIDAGNKNNNNFFTETRKLLLVR